MLSSVEQAFVGRDEKRAPLKTPAWEAIPHTANSNSRTFSAELLLWLTVWFT